MDQDLIKKALLSVDIAAGFPSPSNNWKILFDFYNASNERKLSMGCKPCFFKVYQFCAKAILQTLKPIGVSSYTVSPIDNETVIWNNERTFTLQDMKDCALAMYQRGEGYIDSVSPNEYFMQTFGIDISKH